MPEKSWFVCSYYKLLTPTEKNVFLLNDLYNFKFNLVPLITRLKLIAKKQRNLFKHKKTIKDKFTIDTRTQYQNVATSFFIYLILLLKSRIPFPFYQYHNR